MRKYEIKKDKYLNVWIIWERLSSNSYLDIYHCKTKKECVQWLSTQ